ncbi:hypothetical protein AMTR_s00112p00103010 [Amborella trichopoda]|uniref:Uncharacterized protein n=1 Tax=Amborella trichopoda TaxID=13333 RepID=W1NWV2_AMBTC|nr:hypothetical protein AMTR_s00112p00103010 [Amborella trichopoda]
MEGFGELHTLQKGKKAVRLLRYIELLRSFSSRNGNGHGQGDQNSLSYMVDVNAAHQGFEDVQAMGPQTEQLVIPAGCDSANQSSMDSLVAGVHGGSRHATSLPLETKLLPTTFSCRATSLPLATRMPPSFSFIHLLCRPLPAVHSPLLQPSHHQQLATLSLRRPRTLSAPSSAACNPAFPVLLFTHLS